MIEPRFESIGDIPDLMNPQLLFSEERTDLHVPKEPRHRPDTTTPVEVTFCVYRLGIGGLGAEKMLLENMVDWGISSDEFLDDDWGSHLGRAIVRVMLDPNRHAPISMPRVYENELESAQSPAEEEKVFFEKFVELYGVLNRDEKMAA